MTNNLIDIKVNPKISRKDKTLSFSFTLMIDNHPINESHLFDLYGVLNLVIKKQKSHVYFWNCECGYPECAGIEPLEIKKTKQEELFLFIPIPCSSNHYQDKDYQYWKINHTIKMIKINRVELAKKLWDKTFEIENIINRFSSKLQLLQWPAKIIYEEYIWPENLPVNLRNELFKDGYSF